MTQDAAASDKKKTFREKLKDTREVISVTPRVFALIWKANAVLTCCFLVLNIVLGLLPVLNIWVSRLLVDNVTNLFSKSAALTTVSTPVTIFGIAVPANIVNALLLMCLSWFLAGILQPTRRYCQQQLGDDLSRHINIMILKKTNTFADIRIFEDPKFYDQLQRAQNESSYRPLQMLETTAQLFERTITLGSLVMVIALFNVWLILLVIFLVLPHAIVQIRHIRESWAMADGEVPEVRRMRYFSGVLTNNYDAKEVRLFGLRDFFLQRYLDKFLDFQKRHADLRRSQLLRNFSLAVLATVGSVVTYASIVLQAVAGKITVGMMIMYTGAISQIEESLLYIVWGTTELYGSSLYIKRLFDFLEIQPSMSYAPVGEVLDVPWPFKQGIEFRNVSFKYPDSDRMILDGVSFRIMPGQAVALVGENGAGKTTIVKLISRLYDPIDGQIFLDGIDLKQYDLDQWRSAMAVVFQDYCRFHMTAGENIGLGKVDDLDNLVAVKAASERSGATKVIDKLENGFETMLGKWFADKDAGAELSGGEWQKIALARAFMRTHRNIESNGPDDDNGNNNNSNSNGNGNGENNGHSPANSTGDKIAVPQEAQLLILDEPTASLDVQSEFEVYSKFHELTTGKSALLISHRFSTVRMADRILVLENGKIVEEGHHDELIAIDSMYARLFNLQADRYK